MSDLVEIVKLCKECGAKKTIDNYLSVDGLSYVGRCFKCRAKIQVRSEIKLSKKRAAQFGEDWEQRVKEGNQCCKKCNKIKPNDRFQRRTKSGISVCWDCGKVKEPLLKVVKPLPINGKYCYTCKEDKSIAEFSPTGKNGHVSSCKNCVNEKIRRKRRESSIGKSSDISYIDCCVCGKFEVKANHKAYHVDGACHACGKRDKNRSKKSKMVTCQMCRCETFSKSGESKYCKPCHIKRRNDHLRKAAVKSYEEKTEFLSMVGKSSIVGYVNCKRCGCSEVKRSGRTYKLIDCCYKCGTDVASLIKYYEKRFEEFKPNRSCDQCNKMYTVTLNDSQKRKCDRCLKANRKKEKRKARQYRLGAKRSARRDGIRYDPYDVFKRDKWKCRLCGIKVHKRNHLLDDAAEIDHIVPISKGGRDIPSNVQCLCRKCNGEKSDRTIGQVSLFAVLDD